MVLFGRIALGVNDLKKLFLFAPVAATLVISGCQGKGGNSSANLATVNGEPITLNEFHSNLEHKQTVQVMTNSGPVNLPVASPLGFQTLKDVVTRKLVLQLAKDEGVLPTSQDVTKELEYQTKRDSSFVPKLQSQGLQLEDIRNDLTFDLAQENLITKGVTVTPAEADKFIKDNPDKFMIPASAQLVYLIVKDDEHKKQVDTEIAKGTAPGTVAANFSIVPKARETQGVFPVTAMSQMPKALQDLVNASTEAKWTDWKKEGDHWVRFFIQRKVAAKPQPIDDTIRTAVLRALKQEKGRAATDLGKKLQDKLKAAKVEVETPYLKDAWAQALKNSGDANAAPAAGAPAAPAAAPAGK